MTGNRMFFFLNNTTKIYLSPLDKLWMSCHARCWWPIFSCQIRNLETQNVSYFSLLQSDMVFEIVNPFSWIFNSISSEKSFLISIFINLHWCQNSKVFSWKAESWLMNSNFRHARHMLLLNLLMEEWQHIIRLTV